MPSSYAPWGAPTLRETFGNDNSQKNMEDYLQQSPPPRSVKSHLSNSSSTFLIANLEDTPATYIQLNTGDAQMEQIGEMSMEIERLYILSDFKRCRLGTLLMHQAFNRARQESQQNLAGNMGTQQARATFYLAMCFKRTGEHVFTLQTDWVMTAQVD